MTQPPTDTIIESGNSPNNHATDAANAGTASGSPFETFAGTAEDAEAALKILPGRANRFYDRLRGGIDGYLKKKGSAAGSISGFLLLVPDVFMLLWRLLRDPRVSGKDRTLLGTAVVYFISPIDLIPEAVFGPIGYIDDLVFGVFVLNKLVRETDPGLLREHWSGSEDVLQMLRRVTAAADNLVGKKLRERLQKMVRSS